ncbi:MAG: hypothetical protein ACP5OZ_03300 [Candidatus Woesearchaeota archaeon]
MKRMRKKEKNKILGIKSQVWVSAVLYIIIILTAMVIILEVAVPVINSFRDRIALENARNSMSALEAYISEVSSEGPGSQRVVPLNVKKGKIFAQDNKLIWQLETESRIMEPRSRIDFGNLIFITVPSNSTVTAYESEDYCYYILENGIIRANITVFGDKEKNYENCSSGIDTSKIIKSITSLVEGTSLSDSIKISLLNDEATTTGIGYTELASEGTYLSYSSVTVYINTTNYYYSFDIKLESGADFLTLKLKEIRKNS